MSRFTFVLPDLGEGTVAAEIVAWHVKAGDEVSEGQTIADISTDKAVVELPSPVSGRVLETTGQPGDQVAVGAMLIVFEQGHGEASAIVVEPQAPSGPLSEASAASAPFPPQRAQVMASPSTRLRARSAGIDLTQVTGTGRGGRIERRDLEQALEARPAVQPVAAAALLRNDTTEEIKILGVRRVIAQRMTESKRTIPHFSYIDEVDVTELEALRLHLNAKPDAPKYTILPFIAVALVRALARFPQCNAVYDSARETIVRFKAVHIGIATQTRDGLKVPVVRHAEALSLCSLSAEIRRIAEAARSNRARRDELSGSTITITSLGKLGGIATTPVINAPEVAIIGINRMSERPVIRAGAIAVRQMMNLSSSFDHRFIDGFDAAEFIQVLKGYLEHPASMFIAA